MNLLTRRNALKLGLAGGVMLAGGLPSLAQLQILVEGANFQPLPVAIPDFASSDPAFGREIADIVRNNLVGSGLFVLVDPGRMPAQVGDLVSQPDFAAWRATGADAVVMGQVDRGGQIQGGLRVWDVQQGVQAVGKSYSTDPQSYRRIGHIISDAIYEALAGETGYFDTRIVYVAESGPKANRVKRLAIMDQDGANLQYITNGRSLVLTPRFSPNGQMLTYVNFEDGNPAIFLHDLRASTPQRLGSFGQMSFAPRFSPDGNSVVFSVEQGGTTNLFALASGQGRPNQLTSGAAIDTGACYSPDGSRIVFESDRGGNPQLYVMSSGGGGAQRISYGQGSYSTPVWAPKGDLIAFTRQSGGQFHIGTMRPDGSDERILVSSFRTEGPTWAPNGRVIMFFKDPGGDGGPSLYSVDVWGRNERRMRTESYASDPAWSPMRT